MRKSLIKALFFFSFSLIVCSNFFSCSSSKKVKYFQDIPDSGILKSGEVKNIPPAEYTPPTIQVGDILNVTLELVDATTASASVNAGNSTSGLIGTTAASGTAGTGASSSFGGGGGSQSQQMMSGYPVYKDGNIEMPIIGIIKAVGYTTSQLKDTIYKRAAVYFKDPVVTVRLVNFKVNVTGEVTKPGQYIIPDEKETIIDAISMAGDLTVFGKRENVLLIREGPGGIKTAYRIDLRKSNILSSPLLYLRQNDVIYVEPRKAKSDVNDASQQKYITIAAAVISLLVIFVYRIN